MVVYVPPGQLSKLMPLPFKEAPDTLATFPKLGGQPRRKYKKRTRKQRLQKLQKSYSKR